MSLTKTIVGKMLKNLTFIGISNLKFAIVFRSLIVACPSCSWSMTILPEIYVTVVSITTSFMGGCGWVEIAHLQICKNIKLV